jgi:hypothetical protein
MRAINADILYKSKFHPFPYTQAIPAGEDAESYMHGWNDAIDAIIEDEPTIEPEPFKDDKGCSNCMYSGRPTYKSPCSECRDYSQWEMESISRSCENSTECEDAVSRRKAFEYFVSLWECIGTIMDREEWEDVCKTTANELPSVTPKRKTGKWIITCEFEDCYYAKCNQCNITQVFYFNKQLTNFCPNCGADMRKENR